MRIDIKEIPVGTWEEGNIRCPPPSKLKPQQVFAEIYKEESGGKYKCGCNIDDYKRRYLQKV